MCTDVFEGVRCQIVSRREVVSNYNLAELDLFQLKSVKLKWNVLFASFEI